MRLPAAQVRIAQTNCALLLVGLERWAEAEALVRDALVLARHELPEEHPDLGYLLHALGVRAIHERRGTSS